jgi:hypothetical protein
MQKYGGLKSGYSGKHGYQVSIRVEIKYPDLGHPKLDGTKTSADAIIS